MLLHDDGGSGGPTGGNGDIGSGGGSDVGGGDGGSVKQEECELDEDASLISDSHRRGMVRVRGYKVNRSIAPTLEHIFNEHGDIAARCQFSSSVKAFFLESVCKVFKQIQTNDIEKLSEVKAVLSDLKAAKIDVAWLEALLEAVRKKKEANKQYCLSLEVKIGIMRVKNSFEIDVRRGRAQLVALREQIKEAQKGADAMRLVEKYLDDTRKDLEADPYLVI
ncbi:putative phospholipase [Helianthus annuus]|nr:putative phospholipase [Helianthus annuus]